MALHALLLVSAVIVFAQMDPSINTPTSLVQCQPAQLTWTASKTPISISVLAVNGAQVGTIPFVEFVELQGNSYTWAVTVQKDTHVALRLRDSQNTFAYSVKLSLDGLRVITQYWPKPL
ncbi:hypothetical protein OPQ81_001913 [Rhizoctonia solani]|nr:hypothetical protein OPQ81_001913 [Rhizoctonia solani]